MVVFACVNDVFFTFFYSNTMSISFVHSFLLSSVWWFVHGETTFLFWSLLGKKSPHQQQQNQQHKDVFLYIWKTTFQPQPLKFKNIQFETIVSFVEIAISATENIINKPTTE
jgi:hypothetical protein